MSQTGLQCDKLWKELWDDKEAVRWHLLAGFIFKTWNAITKNRSWVCRPLPYKIVTQQIIPPVGLFMYLFVTNITKYIHMNYWKKCLNWLTGQFQMNLEMALAKCKTFFFFLSDLKCNYGTNGINSVDRNKRFWQLSTLLNSAKMPLLYATKTKQQHSALAC